MSITAVSIAEWSSAGPVTHQELSGIGFGSDAKSRSTAGKLTSSGMIEILELANGLSIRSTSYVGTLDLGPLRLAIFPKLDKLPLFELMKYAYGLRDLTLYDRTRLQASDFPFQELLLHQLDAEAQELITRGLRRDYIRRNEHLSSPRGRFDFAEMAVAGGTVRATLPCRYHLRSEDCLHNQILLAGLKSGVRLTDDLQLRARLRKKMALLTENVSGTRLDWRTMGQADRQSSRLSRAYDPAFEIIKLLLAGQGTSLSPDDETVPVPGFLFDMNRFFQRLLTRFFSEWLDGYRVEDELAIRGMIEYVVNPRNHPSPRPRPDIVLLKGRKTAAILDAKYRDLWMTPLPREMLYQLAIYALTGEANSQSAILYPTMDPAACEAWLEIRDPRGAFRGYVVLRPAHVNRLAELLLDRRRESARKQLRDYARELAFGGADASSV